MAEALPQIILGLISLATGVLVFITTQEKWHSVERDRDNQHSDLIQTAIEHIERLEKENARLRETRNRLRGQLNRCSRELRRERDRRYR